MHSDAFKPGTRILLADDLIATYVEQILKKGAKVTIVSGDKDFMQLVKPGVRLYDPMKSKVLGNKEVKEKFGVEPNKVIDVQALAGDSSDNVPGVPGIGIKTAAELINKYKSLDNLLEKANESPFNVSSITNAAVGGEALPPSLRDYFKSCGIDVLQSYGTADLGLVAYESPAMDGMILDEGVIVEIVRPGTGEPMDEGEIGEIVVTSHKLEHFISRGQSIVDRVCITRKYTSVCRRLDDE